MKLCGKLMHNCIKQSVKTEKGQSQFATALNYFLDGQNRIFFSFPKLFCGFRSADRNSTIHRLGVEAQV